MAGFFKYLKLKMRDQPSQQWTSVPNELRLQGLLTDADIKVKNVTFPVHKVILCNCSPYFRALFTRWSNPQCKVYTIPGITPNMMRLMLDYFYTGFLSVTDSNVVQLLLAADQFSAMEVVKRCCDYLQEILHPKNCIGIWKISNDCAQNDLCCKAFRYILEHFEEVVHSDEFQLLSVEELLDIIKTDNLIVRQERTVYEAIMRWISTAPEERQRHLPVLLSKVRLVLLGRDYLINNVQPNKMVKNSHECLSLVTKATEATSEIITNGPNSGTYRALNRPRLPSAILLATGGWSGNAPTNAIEAYDVRAGSWTNLTSDHLQPRAYHGTAFLNNSVYYVGGFNRVEHFNSVCRFDPISHTWHEVAPMYTRRCYVSVTVLNGCIYALGGFDGVSRLNTAEYYRSEINQWSFITPMHMERSDASCTTFLNRVYICGGFNGHQCLQTAEYYSPETNSWTLITPMISLRSGLGVVAYAERVYAVGGFDGNTRLRTVEAYSPQTNTWERVDSMISPRSNFGIEVIEDQLFAVGGFNGLSTTFDTEYYDAATNQWIEVQSMEIFRSALSCCVISGLPNMADFAAPRDATAQAEGEHMDAI